MKAWDQISSNEDNRIFTTLNSSWYIDHGVKIERFDDDGKIEVMNTMTSSDFHEPVSSEQMHFFENVGWEAGCYKVNIDTLDRRANFYQHLLYLSENEESPYESETIEKRLSKVLEKKEQYVRKLEKILKTL